MIKNVLLQALKQWGKLILLCGKSDGVCKDCQSMRKRREVYAMHICILFFQIILESIKAFLTWPLITQYTAKHVFEACFPMAFTLFTPGTSKDSNSCILEHNKISVYIPKCTFKILLIKTGNYSI